MEPAAQVLHWEQRKASKGHQTGSVTSSIHISISYMLILEGRGRSEAISANTGHVASQSQAWCTQTVQSDFKATTGDRKEGNKGLSLHPVLHKKKSTFPPFVLHSVHYSMYSDTSWHPTDGFCQAWRARVNPILSSSSLQPLSSF